MVQTPIGARPRSCSRLPIGARPARTRSRTPIGAGSRSLVKARTHTQSQSSAQQIQEEVLRTLPLVPYPHISDLSTSHLEKPSVQDRAKKYSWSSWVYLLHRAITYYVKQHYTLSESDCKSMQDIVVALYTKLHKHNRERKGKLAELVRTLGTSMRYCISWQIVLARHPGMIIGLSAGTDPYRTHCVGRINEAKTQIADTVIQLKGLRF